MRLVDVAESLGCRLEGDGAIEIAGVGSLEGARPRELTFVSDARHLPRLAASAAAAVILAEGWPGVDRPALRTANPLLAFARALTLFHPTPAPRSGIHPTSVVASDCQISPEAEIGPLCVLEPGVVVGPGTVLEAHVFVGTGVRIGAGCRLFPQVTLRDGSWLGDRVVLHSGVVIGADGFGYAREGARRIKIPQVGRVVIEDDVEIGANAAIDRATLGETRIGRGTKIDNLVQIGHNVQVGPDAVIVAQVGISGSSAIGARATLAGQVGVVDHVRIGEDAIVGAQAGVTKDVPAGAIVLGSPAGPHQDFKRQLAALARLPELRRAVQALEARLRAVEAGQDG